MNIDFLNIIAMAEFDAVGNLEGPLNYVVYQGIAYVSEYDLGAFLNVLQARPIVYVSKFGESITVSPRCYWNGEQWREDITNNEGNMEDFDMMQVRAGNMSTHLRQLFTREFARLIAGTTDETSQETLRNAFALIV